MIPKGGDPSQQANFLPIALTSVVSKLFHKLLARRLKYFLTSNNIIDPSLQKGFLSGINGTVEHIFSLCSILDNAVQHNLPLAMSFLDLQNAFGLVAHGLIHDILHHVQLPHKFISYITFGYTHLSGKVKTKSLCTPSFKIERGVFQGDTLSPLIFLLAFNPLIELCKSLSSCGFQLLLPVPNSNGLPPINSAIYIQWDEASSNEAPGWYYAVVKEYFEDGKARIEYADLATEILDLHSIPYELTRKGQKPYLPFSKPPSKFPLTKIREESSKSKLCSSNPHSVKGYTDDISVISNSIPDHKLALSEIDQKSSDLDLSLRPDKCVSMVRKWTLSLKSPYQRAQFVTSLNLLQKYSAILWHSILHKHIRPRKKS